MTRWSLKMKVGVYAALLTMAALIAGAVVMMVTLYFYQIAELDEELHRDVEELVWDLKNFRDAPADPHAPLSAKFVPVDMRQHYLIVQGMEGQILYQSANLKVPLICGDVGQARTIKIADQSTRVVVWKMDPYIVKVGAKLNVIHRFQKDLGMGFATALPVVGLVVFFGGLWLGRSAVGPVAKLSAAAERISANNPTERLPQPAARDEISKMTEVLNRSFDRLQESYEIATRFSADASHQMKTPVAILRAGLDHLSRATDLTEAQSAEVSMLRQQTRRLTSLIEDLLLLAQADAGRMLLVKEKLDLGTLIQAARDDLQALVEGRGILVEENLPNPLPVYVDRRLVAMVLQNLVENAAKYTSDGGIVCITGFQDTGGSVVQISNTGRQIPLEDREGIFERFRRGSLVGGNIRGYGLGLNIARELIRAHGGELLLKESEPGWIVFEFRLPRS